MELYSWGDGIKIKLQNLRIKNGSLKLILLLKLPAMILMEVLMEI